MSGASFPDNPISRGRPVLLGTVVERQFNLNQNGNAFAFNGAGASNVIVNVRAISPDTVFDTLAIGVTVQGGADGSGWTTISASATNAITTANYNVAVNLSAQTSVPTAYAQYRIVANPTTVNIGGPTSVKGQIGYPLYADLTAFLYAAPSVSVPSVDT